MNRYIGISATSFFCAGCGCWNVVADRRSRRNMRFHSVECQRRNIKPHPNKGHTAVSFYCGECCAWVIRVSKSAMYRSCIPACSVKCRRRGGDGGSAISFFCWRCDVWTVKSFDEKRLPTTGFCSRSCASKTPLLSNKHCPCGRRYQGKKDSTYCSNKCKTAIGDFVGPRRRWLNHKTASALLPLLRDLYDARKLINQRRQGI